MLQSHTTVTRKSFEYGSSLGIPIVTGFVTQAKIKKANSIYLMTLILLSCFQLYFLWDAHMHLVTNQSHGHLGGWDQDVLCLSLDPPHPLLNSLGRYFVFFYILRTPPSLKSNYLGSERF